MNDINKLKLPEKSDYQLLFQTCIKDLAYPKDQQWKTVHLTLIALAALLVASEKILCVYVSCFFVVVVTFIGLRFLHEHQKALLSYRDHEYKIIDRMPDFYNELHQSREDNKNNKDIRFFSHMFETIIFAFALFVFFYAIYKGGRSMPEYHDFMRIVFVAISYILIICGSIGMMVFATRFSFSSRIKDLELMPERFLGLNGYRVWWWSWLLIILGTAIQLLDFRVRCAS